MSNSREFNARRFAWLDQLIGRHPGNAFKVAYRIAQMFDEDHGGEAREGCQSIGKVIGLSEQTVVRLVHRLHAKGDLGVRWGRPGRGHSNRYWMLLKPPATEVSSPTKPPEAEVLQAQENLQTVGRKPPITSRKPPAAEVTSKTSIETSGARARGPAEPLPGGSLARANGAHSPPDAAPPSSEKPAQPLVPTPNLGRRQQPKLSEEEKRLADERRKQVEEWRKGNYGLKPM